MKKFGKKGAVVIVLVLAIAAGVLGYQRYEAAQAAEAAFYLGMNVIGYDPFMSIETFMTKMPFVGSQH